MPYCPNCRSEYDIDVKVCNDCQCELVDELETGEPLKPIREAYLLTAADEMEYKILEAKLNEYDIPLTIRYRGAGGITQIYMGRTFGLDVYVPEAAMQKAKEILSMTTNSDQVNEIGEAEELYEALNFPKRGVRGKKILLIFVVMILVALGFLAVMYLILFFRLI